MSWTRRTPTRKLHDDERFCRSFLAVMSLDVLASTLIHHNRQKIRRSFNNIDRAKPG
jgi:hypothetical protein